MHIIQQEGVNLDPDDPPRTGRLCHRRDDDCDGVIPKLLERGPVLIRFVIVLMVAVLLSPLVASAQAIPNEDVKPENIKRLDFERPIVEYICAGGFIVAAMAIGFKPSKRTHD